MLGSIAEAEDAAQDAYLRWRNAHEEIWEPGAYLAKVVTRICLDTMKSARDRHETDASPRLPEPIIEQLEATSVIAVDSHIEAPIALMFALERLSLLERAVFLLYDVLDMEFSEIAAAIERSKPTCRQLPTQARRNVQTGTRHQDIPAGEAKRIASGTFNAAQRGMRLGCGTFSRLQPYFTAMAAVAKLLPVGSSSTSTEFVRLLVGLARKAHAPGECPTWHELVRINGLPGYISHGAGGALQTTALQVEGGAVAAVYVVRNPDKLGVAALATTGGPGSRRVTATRS
jgi:RNA polymerase sigma-70 factor (ECF subfamily)